MKLRAAATVACSALAFAAMAAVNPGTGTLVTLGEEDVLGNDGSYEGSISNNGKVLAFYSDATNLVSDDDNDESDVFVRDLRTGAVQLISRDEAGNPGNDYSYYPTISANGRFVAWYTNATNLITRVNADDPQIVFTDLRTGDSRQVSLDFDGGPPDGACNLYDNRPLSGNGRWLVFHSDSTDLVEGDGNATDDVFLADLRTGTLERISVGVAAEADGRSLYPSITPNGRWVTFVSAATNLVAGDGNDLWDTFLYDVKRKTTTRISLGTDGVEGNGNGGGTSEYASAISNNGRWAVFRSAATNLDPSRADANGFDDIFLRDLRANTTKRISLAPTGAEADARSGDPFIHPAGKWVSFFTYAGNLIDATDDVSYDQLIYDVKAGTLARILPEFDGKASGDTSGNYGYWNGMSANGRLFCCTTDTGAVRDDGFDTNDDWDVYLVPVK